VNGPTLETERLVLRRWIEDDRAPLSAIMGDADVMQYRFARLSRAESDALIDDNERSFEANGYGLWAVERLSDHRLLGFVGFGTSDFGAAFCPAVDVGWTLARDVWGQGCATEAAVAALDYGFGVIGFDEVVAHTTAPNERSRAVMHRLGMTHDPVDDFDGPWYAEGHPHRRFVLYRVRAAAWRSRNNQR
jgi:ribosomal-protein-alanine N-acetyltransferase